MSDPKAADVPEEHHVPRTGHWMSQDRRHHHKFLHDTIEHVDANPKELHPVLQELKDLVEKDTRLYMLFNLMLNQVPPAKQYLTDPTGLQPQVRDFDHLLQLINHVMTTAPHWTDAGHKAGLVGVPMNALLDWPMGTEGGFAVFQDPKVNAQFKKILQVWGEYLSSPASASVLGSDDGGWFSQHGIESLESVANQARGTSYSFEEMFHCDPKAEHHGYTSWDNFFTRTFKDGIRPIAGANDDDVVANACESKQYKIARDVKARDQFWVKGQPYSVLDMLAFDPLAEDFIGGTIYQAFLSALSYHRWHSPVSGTIKKAYIVDGTYFSEPLYDGFVAQGKADPQGECTSQEYISATATRAITFIQADNPKIGLMAFIGIGMTEVSTCELSATEGQRVEKGDQLGMFHFGGSTHCILFRKGVEVTEFPDHTDHNVPVRSQLCRVI